MIFLLDTTVLGNEKAKEHPISAKKLSDKLTDHSRLARPVEWHYQASTFYQTDNHPSMLATNKSLWRGENEEIKNKKHKREVSRDSLPSCFYLYT
ncbi:MAG: hypothetical protein J6T98_04975 [Salinivirgaceae bacterium]|nr:hypothetical protein [Salinivirgaceae bacterium]